MSYGYKARELDKTVIDWASVTKNISDNLSAEKKRREGLKLQLEEQHTEQLQKVNEFEQGINPDLNVFAMKQAQQTREFLLMNHKLMTSGLKSVDESKLIKQNVMNTWSTLNSSLKSYNANALRLSDLDGKGNEAVLKAMANQLEIQNKQIYHDPNTGAGYYASLDKEGNIDMNTLVPVRALNNIQSQSFEAFDVDSESSKVARNVAEWKTFITPTQDLKDARLNPNYNQWIDNQTKKALSNDERVASVLMDYLGIEYDVDGNPSKKTVTYKKVKEYKSNGDMVMEDVTEEIGDVEMRFDKNSGKLVPKLSEEQKKLAEAAYQNAIEIQIAREATKQYVAPIRQTDKEKTEANVVGLIDRYVTQGSQSSLDALLLEMGSDGSRKQGNKIFIQYGGKETEVDLTLPPKEIGIKIAGITGSGNVYANKGKANTKADLTKLNYGPVSTRILGGEISKIGETNLLKAIQTNDRKLAINIIGSEIQKAGGDPNLITIDNNGGVYLNTETAIGKQIARDRGAAYLGKFDKGEVGPGQINEILSKLNTKPKGY
jgi:hypothetical protein